MIIFIFIYYIINLTDKDTINYKSTLMPNISSFLL